MSKSKSIKVDDLKNRRKMGFIEKAGLHETEGKLFYLYEKGKEGGCDNYVTSGEVLDSSASWDETKGKFVSPEVFGLVPNRPDKDNPRGFQGAWPFTYDAAQHLIAISTEKLVMVSVDEIKGLKK